MFKGHPLIATSSQLCWQYSSVWISCRCISDSFYREKDGLKQVSAYASRALGKVDHNYPTHKLQFLALKWAITDKFKDYLFGAKVVIYTDNNPLTYILSTAKLDATGYRWPAALGAFDFIIKYKPGTWNIKADILSRLPHRPKSPQEEELSSDSGHPLCGGLTRPVIETHCLSAAAVNILAESEDRDIAEFTVKDWRQAQSEDELLEPWTF